MTSAKHTHHAKPKAAHRHKRPAWVPWAAAGAYALFFLLFCEAAGWAGYSALSGKPAGYGAFAADLAAVRAAEQRQQVQPGNGIRVIHPYLGFATPPKEERPIDRDADEQPLEQYGFDVGSGPLARSPREDRMVVGIFGGSVAKMFWEKGGAAVMAERLKRDPRFAGKEIVISSGAFYSYRQPQHLLSFSYLLTLGAHYDAVVLIDGFNDVFRPEPENMNAAVSPLYPYGWSVYTASLDNDPAFRLLYAKLALQKDGRHARAAWLASTPLKHSFLAAAVWKALDARSAADIRAGETALQTYAAGAADGFAVRGPMPKYPDEDAYFRDRASVWSEGSLQMSRLAAANGIPFFHFLQPNQYLPGSKPLESWERAMMDAEYHYEPGIRHAVEMGYPYLREAGRLLREQHGVAFTDLTQIFSGVTELLYTDDCCHFNEKGNAIMGEAIAEAVLDGYPR